MAEHKITEVSDYTRDWQFTPATGQPVGLTTYYVKVDGIDGVVDVNKKFGAQAPQVGDLLSGSFTKSDYVDKQGNEHYRFKSERKFGGVDLSSVEASLKSLHEKVDKLLAGAEKPVKKPENGLDEVHEVIEGEPVSLDDIPF